MAPHHAAEPLSLCALLRQQRPTRVALTVDHGPSGGGSLPLLDRLRELEVSATFFLICDHLNRAATFPWRALDGGHQLGNQLCRDGFSIRLSPGAFERQLLQAEKEIARASGSTAAQPRWFVLVNVHPGAIEVFHDRVDTLKATLETVRRLVPELRRRGYGFCRLEELSEA